MKYNIKGLVLETVSEVLLEGRLEDVKAKYDEDFADIIDDLSGLDPSGNNKYLAWMANQYFKVDGISLEVIGELIGRYHKELPRINTKLSKEVVEANLDLFPGRETKRVSDNPKDINSFSSMEGLSKVVEASEENVPSSEERDKLYQDDNWTVILPKTHKASCKYGVHSKWCVSVSNPSYFRDYTESGMLAFVLWRGNQDGQIPTKSEGQYKVAVHIKYEEPNYVDWTWWNKSDTRMDSDLVLSIFPPALINAIETSIEARMKSSGYFKDVDFEEIEQKSYVLKMYGEEGRMTYTFIPKMEFGIEWLSKYRDKYGYSFSTNFKEEIPIITLTEPRGIFSVKSIYIKRMVDYLLNPDTWVDRTPFENFKVRIPHNLRSRTESKLDDVKLLELWEFFKTHTIDNFDDYLPTKTTDLSIGDRVKWDRKPFRLQSELGPKVGVIVRQTASGMFVVDVNGEDKPSRFKPNRHKNMLKRYDNTNLPTLSVLNYTPSDVED